ncbi:hypothetical protein ACS0TY_015409 [Phlomoides rotata]
MILKLDEQPASFKPLTTTKKYFMVGFKKKSNCQIITIVGMEGIGKTTFAKSIYDNLLIVESFDVCAWVTISQIYNVKNVLSELLSCLNDGKINNNIRAGDCEMNLGSEDHELGLKLYQTLLSRRYLILLDDMWCVQRSRVVINTKISSVATHLSSSSFEINVFPERGCPPELEEIRKKIVRECKRLILSIVVIGGLLRNSRATHEY